MLGAYFSPLAPAAILLLSALILPIVIPRLSINPKIQEFAASGMVGIAMLSLLGLRISSEALTGIDGSLELFSGWNFSTVESAAALMVQANTLSIAFIFVGLVVLLAATLLHSSQGYQQSWLQLSGWLVMGAGACLVFISGNPLTILYTILVFDLFTAGYCVYRGVYQLGVARLFLGLFTIAAISFIALLSYSQLGAVLLGISLWLRLGLYPFLEISQQSLWYDDERLVYLGVSLAVGLYITFTLIGNISLLVYGLAIIVMLLSGLLTWLTPALHNAVIPSQKNNLLAWFMVTESLLVLGLIPANTGLALTFTCALIFSFIVLWLTPALGKLSLAEGSWLYLPAVIATLTLIGLPFTLGWAVRLSVYESVFRIDSGFVLGLVVIAELLAFSGLTEYWLILSRGDEVVNYRLTAVGFIVAVPFLGPVLGPIFVSSISDGIELSPAFVSILINVAIVTGAVALAYFRADILSRLKIPTQFITEIAQLHWCLRWGESSLNYVSKGILRVRITLEGQHYLAWAMLAALIGAIIILLN